MNHSSDTVKRQHHIGLIRAALEGAFGGYEISEPIVGARLLTFVVRHPRTQQARWLEITEEVLIDSCDDSDLENAIEAATDLMREETEVRVILHAPGGIITASRRDG